MTERQETVLLGWARDAGGDAQRFTGDDIYHRAGVWCMHRLMRGIPAISTFHCFGNGIHFTTELAVVPMASAPFASLRPPDKVNELAPDFVLLAYARARDG